MLGLVASSFEGREKALFRLSTTIDEIGVIVERKVLLNRIAHYSSHVLHCVY